jgi:hypothetical protein
LKWNGGVFTLQRWGREGNAGWWRNAKLTLGDDENYIDVDPIVSFIIRVQLEVVH